ncbi:HLA class II histocompatibility antigen, DR alpha chain-like [Bufo gargarizans]|uniref:HLA class II histocompatibility antigen, DR alpha chain-like n=1 Tax=Bufo gargarizans TaxID=30331 RepID=UPI001CF58E06|nr:HLA class II histocompatibility antigen, DR alpha chain-like [Bufo gargarizans]
MSPRKLLTLGLLCILYVHTSQAVKVENILTQSNYFQTLEPTGEFMFQFDGDEIFHVDLQRKETKWRLPQFGEVASFDTAGALQNIGILKYNLDICEKMSNYTKAKSVARDDIHIYTEKPLVLGEPVTLVCLATQFFPPVIKMSWLKNNEPVTVGVTETVYYPASDGSFSKFLYLATVPQKGDVYTCSVEHDGLSVNPTNKFWYPEVPSHISHSSKNIICGLGLAFGIFGIVVGIVLIFKGRKNMNKARGH